MRFMVLVKADAKSEAGAMPTEADLVAVGKFNDELIKAGVLLAGEGLHPTSKAKRLRGLGNGKVVITDGPFAETKELLAGFWMIQAASMAEAVEWFRRCPPECGEVEIRQVFESADFAPFIETDEGRKMLEAEEAFRQRAQS